MNIPVIDRLLVAVNALDPDGIAACFTEDYRSDWPAHPNLSFVGRETVRSNQVSRFARKPTVQAEIVHSAVVGNEVWQEWRFYEGPGGAEERGVIILVIDLEQDLIQSSRFYMEPVRDIEPM